MTSFILDKSCKGWDIGAEEKKMGISDNKEVKSKEDNSALEIKKDEKKTVQIQSEMPGLDEKVDEKSSNHKEKEKDLEIPAFLRNRSN